MVITFANEAQFRHLLASLAQEMVDANIHWKLRRDLAEQAQAFSAVYNESPTFWSLTFQAHVDATVFRLIRIFDGNSASLSLRNLLDTIAANLDIFDSDKFRVRLQTNPFVDSLASDAHRPDASQLAADMKFVSNENPLVKNLTVWRNNLFAHKSAANVVENRDLSTDYPLTDKGVDDLLLNAMAILNRYSSLFEAATYSTKIVGADDFQYVLKTIQARLDEHEKEIERELLKYEQAAPAKS